MNIFQKINAVMKSTSYVKKDATVGWGNQSYNAVSHDAVAGMLHPLLAEHGIVVFPSLTASESILGHTSKGSEKIRYEATYEVSFVNVDDPADRLVLEIQAHADDNGDKAPGKAVSYAVKMAMLKVFMLETGDNDESRYGSPDDPVPVKKNRGITNKFKSASTLDELQTLWGELDKDEHALYVKDKDAAKARIQEAA